MAAMLLPSVLFPAPSHEGQSTTTPHTEAVAPVARPAWVLAAYVSLWLATVCNYPLWRALAQLPGSQGLRPFAFAVAFAVAIAATLVALTSVFAWRHTLKPMLSLLLLAAAAGAYFMLSYGIVIDSTMLVNALQTDVHETQDLLNWRLPATVLALAGPPLVWLWRQPVLYRQVGRQLLHNTITLAMSLLVAAGALLLFFQDFSSTMRNHTEMRYLINPLNSIYALGNIAAKPLRRDTSKILPMGEDVKLGASYAQQQRPPLLVLVVGETGRSGNFGINGYSRNTTPELGARKDISTALNAWSCGTNTAASVPCMFSHLDKAAFESRKAEYENLPDMLQRAGLAVLWVDNQAGCKGVCARVPSFNFTTAEAVKAAGCVDECLDTAMLQGLDERIAALPAAQRARGVVVVLHQMGSHGPAYAKRSAPAQKHFMPECTSNVLQECSRDQLVNAYDNSIVETDHFLNSVIQWLEAKEGHADTAMVYVADHGESLGENGIYLHGMPYSIAPDVQKHVPWVTWLSPSMQTRTGISTGCLQQNMRDKRISHDSYFHSVLGLLDVQTGLHQLALDVYADCAAATSASASKKMPLPG